MQTMTPVQRTTISLYRQILKVELYFPTQTLNGVQCFPQKKSSKDSLGLLRILISNLHLIVISLFLMRAKFLNESGIYHLFRKGHSTRSSRPAAAAQFIHKYLSPSITPLSNLCHSFTHSFQPFCQTRPYGWYSAT